MKFRKYDSVWLPHSIAPLFLSRDDNFYCDIDNSCTVVYAGRIASCVQQKSTSTCICEISPCSLSSIQVTDSEKSLPPNYLCPDFSILSPAAYYAVKLESETQFRPIQSRGTPAPDQHLRWFQLCDH